MSVGRGRWEWRLQFTYAPRTNPVAVEVTSTAVSERRFHNAVSSSLIARPPRRPPSLPLLIRCLGLIIGFDFESINQSHDPAAAGWLPGWLVSLSSNHIKLIINLARKPPHRGNNLRTKVCAQVTSGLYRYHPDQQSVPLKCMWPTEKKR